LLSSIFIESPVPSLVISTSRWTGVALSQRFADPLSLALVSGLCFT
jgi:hypothetical protein